MREQPDRPALARAPEQLREDLLALQQRHVAQIEAIEPRQIEREEDQLAAAGIERVLEHLEAAAPVGVERHHLAVDPGVVAERAERLRDRREAIGPIVAGACEELRRVAFDACQQPVAVQLELVDPIAALRRHVHQRRELRLELRGQRLAQPLEFRGAAAQRSGFSAPRLLAGTARPHAIGLARDRRERTPGRHARGRGRATIGSGAPRCA